MCRSQTYFTLCLIFLFQMVMAIHLPTTTNAQSLDTIRREATTPTPRSRPSRDEHRHHHHCDDDDDSFLGALLGVFIEGMFESATASPDTSIDFQYDNHVASPPPTESFLFAHYPYADGLDGYRFDERFEEHLDVRPEERGQSLWFEYGNDFDQIQRYSMKFLFEDRDGWNLDGEWSFFHEELDGDSDHLHVGDFNILVPFIQSESLTAYWGGGMNWLSAGGREEFDWNSTFKFNAFPGRPWIISGEVDYGELGSVHLVHTALSTGINWKHGEVFVGYDYRKIGSTELHGPMLGGRLWW